MNRILAVDPGEKRIGLALSDPTATIANPLSVFNHVSRDENATRITEIAREHDVSLIIVGMALDSDGEVGPQARKSIRMADAIRLKTDIEVKLWDEGGSTQMAKQAGIQLNTARKKRKGHLDSIAATVILQSYLDSIS
jgi:putative Holliday junction resolvase